MIDPSKLPLFFVASVTIMLIPGPAVLYIITRSVDQGRTAGFISILGLHTGTLVHIVAAALGLSAILLSSALAFSVVKYLGAIYLVYLGIQKLRSHESIAPTESSAPSTNLKRIYSQGIVVNVLNPKMALFFFAFLPQFVNPHRGSVGAQMVMLGLMSIGIALFTDGTYAFLAGTLGQKLKNSQKFWRRQRYIAGSIYIGLGVTTAVSGSGKK